MLVHDIAGLNMSGKDVRFGDGELPIERPEAAAGRLGLGGRGDACWPRDENRWCGRWVGDGWDGEGDRPIYPADQAPLDGNCGTLVLHIAPNGHVQDRACLFMGYASDRVAQVSWWTVVQWDMGWELLIIQTGGIAKDVVQLGGSARLWVTDLMIFRMMSTLSYLNIFHQIPCAIYG
ncbi:hypothetical protein BO71DRAFT_399743 [Aspergillus ellipticus CBS 707.79]|uniref:Uncharacterized protein n=1 Tax=Aspergillus ellipticus CBS 707.79 TaxID=1448320 RepID=A0A319DQ38_9EURO|nr:hypothetical protein BO71DRAFT_399743 [Aspergillus ellipticus CBS 707.79]